MSNQRPAKSGCCCNDLKRWGRRGWIAGPQESLPLLIQRVKLLQEVQANPSAFGHQTGEVVAKKEWEPVLSKLIAKLGTAPDWIVAFYSNRRLRPWHGAMSWIYTHATGSLFPLVQLRKTLKKGSYFGYSKEEVLEHEALHALRSAYPESRFEEMFACALSDKKLRGFWGGLFRRPRQTAALLGVVGGVALFQSGAWLGFTAPWFETVAKWITLVPVAYLGVLTYWLRKDHRLLRRALRRIDHLFDCREGPMAVAFRLTDSEIEIFARLPQEEIARYIAQQKSLRWSQLLLQFPLKSL